MALIFNETKNQKSFLPLLLLDRLSSQTMINDTTTKDNNVTMEQEGERLMIIFYLKNQKVKKYI